MDNLVVLNKQAESVKHLLFCDDRLAKAIQIVGEITYVSQGDSFPFLVDTIIGQMLSNKVADIISDRFRTLCDNMVLPERITTLSIEQLRGIGLSKQKCEYILGIAGLLLNTPDYFEKLSKKEDNEIINELTGFRGIGSWSAKMYLIFVLDRQDVLPFEDGAFLQAYSWLYGLDNPSVAEIKKCGNYWKPYSSVAARYLYQLLDLGFTKRKDIYCVLDEKMNKK